MFVSENVTGTELYQELKTITARYTNDSKEFKLYKVSKLANSCGNENCKLEQCLGCEIQCSNDVLDVIDEMNILLKWNSETSFNQKEAMVI
jgi:tyrosine-protein phosphatase YwqE